MPVEVVGKDVLKMTFVLRLSAHQELKQTIWTFQSVMQEAFHL